MFHVKKWLECKWLIISDREQRLRNFSNDNSLKNRNFPLRPVTDCKAISHYLCISVCTHTHRHWIIFRLHTNLRTVTSVCQLFFLQLCLYCAPFKCTNTCGYNKSKSLTNIRKMFQNDVLSFVAMIITCNNVAIFILLVVIR